MTNIFVSDAVVNNSSTAEVVKLDTKGKRAAKGIINAASKPTASKPTASKLPQDDLPQGYWRNAAGVICECQEDNEGNQFYVPLFLSSIDEPYLEDGRDPCLYFKTRVKGVPRLVVLKTADLGGTECRKELLRQFVLPARLGKGSLERVSQFFLSWVHHLKEHKDMVKPRRCGWTDDGFSFGGVEYTPAGKTEAMVLNEFVQDNVGKKSDDARPWFRAWELVAGRPDLECIVAMAFASPLIALLGHNGVTLSAYSTESGTGKSTAQALSAAVWANYRQYAFKMGDTYNSVMNRFGVLNNLPAYWDELKTKAHIDTFLQIAFDVTMGREKTRSRIDGTARTGGSWKTCLTVCANLSVVDHAAQNGNMSDASVMRIFEFQVEKARSDLATADATARVADLEENYGLLGEMYAEYLGANREKVKGFVLLLAENWEKKLKARQQERFWVALIACILAGAKLARDEVGVEFNIESLDRFLEKEFHRMRGEVHTSDSDITQRQTLLNTFQQILGAGKDHTLWTDTARTRENPKVSVKITRDTSRLRDVCIHYVENERILRVAKSFVRDWCAKTGKVQFSALAKSLKDNFGADDAYRVLGSGTHHKTSQISVFEIDLKDTPEIDPFVGELPSGYADDEDGTADFPLEDAA